MSAGHNKQDKTRMSADAQTQEILDLSHPTSTMTELEIEHGLPPGWGEGWSGRVLFWRCV